MKRVALIVLLTCGAGAAGPLDYLADLAPYRPLQQVNGTIRNYGNNYIPAHPEVKTVALESVEPTLENVWRWEFPLTRYTTVVINRAPGAAVDPKVKEFIRYLVSRDGMEAVVRDGAYLPLTRELIQRELGKLE